MEIKTIYQIVFLFVLAAMVALIFWVKYKVK